MVGMESVKAMIRNLEWRLKLAPFTISVTKCEAVEALPPFPQTKICRLLVARFGQDRDGLRNASRVDSFECVQELRFVIGAGNLAKRAK